MKKRIVISYIVASLLAFPTIIFAQNLITIVQNIMNTAVAIIAIIAGGFVVIMFVIAGFKYLTAQGEMGKVKEANNAVIWGLIGTAVIVLAAFIQGLVATQLGV